jgi:regulator of protease activity HflC (stomatin/prohibitin superfamily)
MKRVLVSIGVIAMAAGLGACGATDIPQAHRGSRFERTGLFKLFVGGRGFQGPALNPGSYYAGAYTDIMMVDCSMVTAREPLNALTKDGVQFGLDIYVRFSVQCTDDAVKGILAIVTPDQRNIVTSQKFYDLFVKPEIGESVRQVVSPYRANELNDRREELLNAIKKRVLEGLTSREKWIIVHDVNLSNLDFPDAMDAANVERAVQSVLRDKAIAERERVQAEIVTTRLRRQLAEQEGEVAATKIDRIGAALRRNPDFMQYDLQSKMPDIYKEAGSHGNLVIAAPSPQITIAPRVSAGGRVVAPPEPPPPTGVRPSPRPNPILDHERVRDGR